MVDIGKIGGHGSGTREDPYVLPTEVHGEVHSVKPKQLLSKAQRRRLLAAQEARKILATSEGLARTGKVNVDELLKVAEWILAQPKMGVITIPQGVLNTAPSHTTTGL